eukprot:963406-Amphidinium_carterae.1
MIFVAMPDCCVGGIVKCVSVCQANSSSWFHSSLRNLDASFKVSVLLRSVGLTGSWPTAEVYTTTNQNNKDGIGPGYPQLSINIEVLPKQ